MRKAARLSRRAESLADRGQLHEGLAEARRAFAELRSGDLRRTFPRLGYIVVVQLHELASRLGTPSTVRVELEDALKVLRDLRTTTSAVGQKAVDEGITWIEERVAGMAE